MNRAPATNDCDSPPDPPPRKGQGRRLAIPLFGFLGMVGLVVLFPVPVCRVMALVDCHTGSRQGYCRWMWGGRSGEWYKASAIEAFMREHHPTELQPRWVSYQGNGMNLFGVGLDRSHGSPGPIISLHPTVIDAYCRTTSDAEKHRLYQVLSGGSTDEVHALVEQIILGRVEETEAPTTSNADRSHVTVPAHSTDPAALMNSQWTHRHQKAARCPASQNNAGKRDAVDKDG